MADFKQITNITADNVTTSWVSTPGIRAAILDRTNPAFLRSVTLDSGGIRVSTATHQVGLNIAEYLKAAVACDPTNMTWPPIIVAQPNNTNVSDNSAAAFQVTASAEISISYKWQISTDSGGNWSNVSDAGVYTNSATNHLNISNSHGLNAKQYRCFTSDTVGNTISNAAILGIV